MQLRTDLAIESVAASDVNTVVTDGVEVVTVTIAPSDARDVGKPAGRYVTLTMPSLTDDEHDLQQKAYVVGAALQKMLPPDGCVLVVGLGNRAITPDALGPQTASLVLATRHIGGEFARSVGLCDLRSVAVLQTDVLGNTGMESFEVVEGICRRLQPSAVIAVDALAASHTARLGRTVQITDSGIAPGSGVGNNRRVLNREGLGVPVIGLGVPTVVDAATIARDMTDVHTAITPNDTPLMVTPREIDLLISRAARLLAMSIDAALHPSYEPLELLSIAM